MFWAQCRLSWNRDKKRAIAPLVPELFICALSQTTQFSRVLRSTDQEVMLTDSAVVRSSITGMPLSPGLRDPGRAGVGGRQVIGGLSVRGVGTWTSTLWQVSASENKKNESQK